MNAAHLHLATNHFPVVGLFIGLGFLAIALWRGSAEFIRFCLGYFVFLGVITVAVHLTGEPAEEFVEHLPTISETAIERHEDAAVAGLIAVELVAGLSLIGLFVGRLGRSRTYGFLLFGAVLLACILMARTANLGGRIHHPEIESGIGAGESG